MAIFYVKSGDESVRPDHGRLGASPAEQLSALFPPAVPGCGWAEATDVLRGYVRVQALELFGPCDVLVYPPRGGDYGAVYVAFEILAPPPTPATDAVLLASATVRLSRTSPEDTLARMVQREMRERAIVEGIASGTIIPKSDISPAEELVNAQAAKPRDKRGAPPVGDASSTEPK